MQLQSAHRLSNSVQPPAEKINSLQGLYLKLFPNLYQVFGKIFMLISPSLGINFLDQTCNQISDKSSVTVLQQNEPDSIMDLNQSDGVVEMQSQQIQQTTLHYSTLATLISEEVLFSFDPFDPSEDILSIPLEPAELTVTDAEQS